MIALHADTALCLSCQTVRELTEFGTMRGKRKKVCLPCERERWSSNRRRRLAVRFCMSCRLQKSFDQFPTIVKNDRKRLGMSCNECEARLREQGRHRQAPNHFSASFDFSIAAQELLGLSRRLGNREWARLDQETQGRLYALTRELARRHAPTWDAQFDASESPRDRAMREWASLYLDSLPTLPADLMVFIERKAAA